MWWHLALLSDLETAAVFDLTTLARVDQSVAEVGHSSDEIPAEAVGDEPVAAEQQLTQDWQDGHVSLEVMSIDPQL